MVVSSGWLQTYLKNGGVSLSRLDSLTRLASSAVAFHCPASLMILSDSLALNVIPESKSRAASIIIQSGRIGTNLREVLMASSKLSCSASEIAPAVLPRNNAAQAGWGGSDSKTSRVSRRRKPMQLHRWMSILDGVGSGSIRLSMALMAHSAAFSITECTFPATSIVP